LLFIPRNDIRIGNDARFQGQGPQALWLKRAPRLKPHFEAGIIRIAEAAKSFPKKQSGPAMLEKIKEYALNHPRLYQLSQSFFAPGASRALHDRIKNAAARLPPAKLILDVGCGPSSQLFQLGLKPLGVDICFPYVLRYISQGYGAIMASAEALPFESQSFDGIWSTALFHHLSDQVAREAIHEFMRVAASPGYVVILDWVSPRKNWKRPLAPIIQFLDRGKFVRSQEEMEALLPDRKAWVIERFSYSATGLEMVLCRYLKKP